MQISKLINPKKPWLMKRYKGRGWVDTSKAPKWWLSRPDMIEDFFRSLKGVEVFEVGHSAGGRRVIGAAWGKREDLPGRTTKSVSAAIGGKSPDAFYGEGKRKRQGFLFVGATHGTEIDGTVAAVNFLNVIVTGRDLRGKRWPRMREMARKLRIVIVPIFNVDGRERRHDTLHMIGVAPAVVQLVTDGCWKNGKTLGWPECMKYNPLPLDKVGQLGTYFNDNGIDLGYDCGFAWDMQPETRGLVRLMREELPDAVLFSHSDNGSLVQPPECYIPHRFRQRQAQISALVGSRCRREGTKKFSIEQRTEVYAGQLFYNSDLAYHVCGALPLIVEFPWGCENYPNNHDEILDIGMYALEEIVAFGAEYGFRPRHPRPLG